MFEKHIYQNRRNALKSKGFKGVALILGNIDSPRNYSDNYFSFRQDSSFLYFFGLDFSGLAGVIDFDNGEEFIFGNDVDIDDIIWMGPQVPLKENAAKVGVAKTFPFSKFNDFISKTLIKGRKIHILPPYRGENKILLSKSAQHFNKRNSAICFA